MDKFYIVCLSYYALLIRLSYYNKCMLNSKGCKIVNIFSMYMSSDGDLNSTNVYLYANDIMIKINSKSGV